MSRLYIAWLEQQGVPLFRSTDCYWQLYNGALIPASPAPCFVNLTLHEGQELLKTSKAHFLRYSSDCCDQHTEWWYVICDSYNLKTLSSDARRNISRGKRNCLVKSIDARWLAEHGYSCYLAAYNRYTNATPVTKEKFRNSVSATIGGPFEYWAVFVKNNLAGYCQCVVEENIVNTSAGKLDPAYLSFRTSYALDSYMLEHYVVNRGKTMTNGNRSVAHATNFQDYVLKLGYKKQYCRLNVLYQPWLKSAIQITFPFRQFVNRLPDRGAIHNVRALLYQEELRRLCR